MAAINPTQKNRPIQIATPLGEDTLLFYRMNANETVSQLFEYEVELLSEKDEINPEKLLGENVTIGMVMANNEQRYFNGYVTRFGHYGYLGGFSYYRATVRPWLWFLSRAANCRIFQNKTAPDIIKQVIADQGFSSELKDKLKSSYKQREYCVQYRETDFNFISRLMEEEGICYFFTHESGKHQLVLVDSLSAIEIFPKHEEIPFHQDTSNADRSREDHIYEWGFAKEVQTGKYALTDFDPEKPKSDLTAMSSQPNGHRHAGYEIFDYPGLYKESGHGESLVKIRREEHQTRYQQCQGSGNARALATGRKFKLKGSLRKDQDAEYFVISAHYRLENDAYSTDIPSSGRLFECGFTAMLNKEVYRPPRLTPKPLVHGAQTAIVTGPAGEEIHVDKYGRVKLQFHWDRYSKADENSSCWVRVAHPWAGKGWGMIALPRIGQEVIVDFLEGNPDQPIITGRVYNGESMPPYELPAKKQISTIKTNSSKGGGGFNELRFDDTKGSEQIFIHGEKDQEIRIKHDQIQFIGNERHLIVEKDLLQEIKGDQHTTVKGDSNEEVTGTISIKASQDMQEKVGMKYGLDAGQEVHIKAGMNVVIEAGMTLTIKAGSNFIQIGPAGVSISGMPLVNINSGGAAGSGSGCSPDKPKSPKEAAKEQAGKADEAAKPKKPPKPTKYGPTATALKMAAQKGSPFCDPNPA